MTLNSFGVTFEVIKVIFNHNAEWLKLLETSYCPNVIEKDYSIRTDAVKKAIQKLQLKKSPGPDLITGLWYKKLPLSFLLWQIYMNVLLTTYKQSQIG